MRSMFSIFRAINRVLLLLTMLYMVLCGGALYAQTQPNRPANNSALDAYEESSGGRPGSMGGVGGVIAFEYVQRARGTGLWFGKTEFLPYTRVDLLDENRQPVSNCSVYTDEQGVFLFPLDPGFNECGVEDSIADSFNGFIRLHAETRRERFGRHAPPVRITQGPTFSPFEVPCDPSLGPDCYTDAMTNAVVDARLDSALRCLRRVSWQDGNDASTIINANPNDPDGCLFNSEDLVTSNGADIAAGMFSIHARYLEDVENRIDEWRNHEDMVDYLSHRLEENIEAAREAVDLTVDTYNYQRDLMVAEREEWSIMVAQARNCASRYASWQLLQKSECWFGFLEEQLHSKVEFLSESIENVGVIALGWTKVGVQWMYRATTSKATLTLWVLQHVSDSPVVDTICETLYAAIATGEMMIDASYELAQISLQLASDFGDSLMAPFHVLSILKDFDDFLQNHATVGETLGEFVESVIIGSKVYSGLVYHIARINILFDFFPERRQHFVDIPVLSVESGGNGNLPLASQNVDLPILSPAFSENEFAPNPASLDVDRHFTLGWVLADMLFRAEMVRSVFDGDNAFTVNEMRGKGVEIVWPSIACGTACYIGQDFDTFGFPAAVQNGTEIYMPTASAYGHAHLPTRLTDVRITTPNQQNPDYDGEPRRHATIAHEMGHYVAHVLNDVTKPIFDTPYSALIDAGKSHLACADDGNGDFRGSNLSTHAAFNEGFADFVALAASGGLNTYNSYNPRSSEVDYVNQTIEPVLAGGLFVLPWTVAGDVDGDGINDDDAVVMFPGRANTNDSDSDGISDGLEYWLGLEWNVPQFTTPVPGANPPMNQIVPAPMQDMTNPIDWGALYNKGKALGRLSIPGMGVGRFGFFSNRVCGGGSGNLSIGPREEARVSSVLYTFWEENFYSETRGVNIGVPYVVQGLKEHACRLSLGSADCGKGYSCQPSNFVFRAFPDNRAGGVNNPADGLCQRIDEDNPPNCMTDGCPYTQVCESGTCVQACISNLECDGDQRCTNNRCVDIDSCESNPAECHSGFYCDPWSLTCEKPRVAAEHILLAAASSDYGDIGPPGGSDNICELRRHLETMLANHGEGYRSQCDPSTGLSDPTCKEQTNLILDTIYAYHTINSDNCEGVESERVQVTMQTLRQPLDEHSESASYVHQNAEAYNSPVEGFDRDKDGKLDGRDGCKNVYDPFADIFDLSACDRDEDSIPNDEDNCPDTWNPDQGDCDFDGIGNVCDNPDEIRECSEIKVLGGMQKIHLDVALYSRDHQAIDPSKLQWSRLLMSKQKAGFYKTLVDDHLSKHPKIACFDKYAENIEFIQPELVVRAPHVEFTPRGYGSGFDYDVPVWWRGPFDKERPDQPVQFKLEWEDPMTGEYMVRCSQMFYPEDVDFSQMTTEERAGIGVPILLEDHYYYLAEPYDSGGLMQMYVGRRGEELLFSVDVDLSALGERRGMVGRYFEPGPGANHLGEIYLYGGRLPSGETIKDVWRLQINYMRKLSTPVLVRADPASSDDGLVGAFDGWMVASTNQELLMVGGAAHSKELQTGIIALSDGSAQPVPRAAEYNMATTTVIDAPVISLGTSEHREPTCMENIWLSIAVDCPEIAVPVQSCSDPQETPCNSSSVSWVESTYTVDWNTPECQATLSQCPVITQPVYIADVENGNMLRGVEDHTAPKATYAQTIVGLDTERAVILFGGQTDNDKSSVSNQLHVYNVDKGYFIKIRPEGRYAPPKRAWAAGVWNADENALYILGGSDQYGKTLTDMWTIQPFSAHPEWQQVNTQGVFDADPKVKASLVWDGDRNEYIYLGGSKYPIDYKSGMSGAPWFSLLARFAIQNNEITDYKKCDLDGYCE